MTECGAGRGDDAVPQLLRKCNADASSALDLEDDMLEQLTCPICQEVPLGEVYQCPNGHPICKECQEQRDNPNCTQCQEAMQTATGAWIRIRIVEGLLDSLWFTCPFRENGCEETFRRGDIVNHKENCIFNGKCIQICKYFGESGKDCQYWTNLSNPEQALEHLENHLEMVEGYFWFNVGRSFQDNPGDTQAMVTELENGTTFLTIAWIDKETDSISFACVCMDEEPYPGEEEEEGNKTVLTLEREMPAPHFKVPNWKLTIPTVSVLEAPAVLEHKPGMVSRAFLKGYLLKDNPDQEEEEG